MLMIRFDDDPECQPGGHDRPERIGRRGAIFRPRHSSMPYRPISASGPDQPKLLNDHGEDAVGGGERQADQFCGGLPMPTPNQPPL